jgi:hypothetical protein
MSVIKRNESDYRGDYPASLEGGVSCTYPNCHSGKIDPKRGYIVWDGTLDLNVMFARVPPVVKLAMQEHLEHKGVRDGYLNWPFMFHAECAAEWGMQLISEALKVDSNVGRVLSRRGEIR